jgi:hypothetical protein
MFIKGIMFDEFYIKDPEVGGEGVKKELRERIDII